MKTYLTLKKYFLILILVFLPITQSYGFWFSEAQKAPEVLGTLKGFELKNQKNESVTLEKFKSKIWIANFIFTSCQGACPLMVERLTQVYKAVGQDVRFEIVSFSVDPEVDTPTTLLKYAKNKKLDDKNWTFLTGTVESMTDVMMNQFKLGFAENILFHSDRMVLVDEKLQIRGYYSGENPDDYQKLLNDVKFLLNQK